MIRRAALAVVAALAISMLAVPAALAAPRPVQPSVGGRAWTVPVIRLYDATPRSYHEGIDIAIRSWNDARIGIRFARTTNRRAAHVVISTRTLPGNVQGRATLGAARRSSLQLDTALVATEPQRRNGTIINLPGGAVPEEIAAVTAHELGHVLGLQHVRGCSLMAPTGTTACRFRPPAGKWACRMQQAGDVRAAARRYGGRGVVKRAAYCRLSATPAGRVRSVTKSASTRTVAASLTWRATTNAFGYVIARGGAGEACPATPGAGVLRANADSRRFSERWGTTHMPKASARYCYSIWAHNGRGALTGPTRRYVDVVTPGPAPVTDLQASVVGADVNFSWTSPAGTRVTRIYRSDQPGATACAVPPFTPIVQVLGAATSATEPGVPSGTWTYAVTRSDDPDDDGESDGPPEWPSAPTCVTVTVA